MVFLDHRDGWLDLDRVLCNAESKAIVGFYNPARTKRLGASTLSAV